MKVGRLSRHVFILLLTVVMLAPTLAPPAAYAVDGTSHYDFIAHAQEASWSSGEGALPFPGSDADSRGFACYKEGVALEDGTTYGRVLETHPEWDAYGHIQGTYPEMTVAPGTELDIWVGLFGGATGTDGVHFQVNFSYWSGGSRLTTAVASVTAQYDGHLDHVRVSLAPYAGKTGQFTLYAGAGASSGRDWAAWAQAEIRPVDSPVVVVTECPLPAAQVGQPYSVYLEAVGAEVPPYHWTLHDGALPAGLALYSDSGLISGAPTAAGTSSFRVAVCDSTELDGAHYSGPTYCSIQVSAAGATPTPVEGFDFGLAVAPDELTIDLDPLVGGDDTSAEVQAQATVSLVSGVAQTVELSLSGVPAGVSSYCLPDDGLPPYTSQCGFVAYATSLPAEGDYDITVTASGGGITRSETVQLHVVRGVYGDLDILSVEPVQVVYGAPLVEDKATAFRVRVRSTFSSLVETRFRLELPDEDWDTVPPYPPPGGLPSGWEYPEVWGPVTISPGDSSIMLPLVPPGQENEPFDPDLNPAGVIEGRCRAPVGPYRCYPDLRVVPRPTDSRVSYTVEVDPWDEIDEQYEGNNEYWGMAAAYKTGDFRLYFVIHMSNATENDLLYCQNYICTTGCCSEPPAASCASGSRTLTEALAEIEAYADTAAGYLLGVLPIADSKVMYAVDRQVRFEDDYGDYMGSMIALARENNYDYVLSVQPWGSCGCCMVGSPGCYVEVWGGPTNAAHELGHGIQEIGYECYDPSPDGCADGCTEVSASTCAASEGFWVNEWAPYFAGSWTSPWLVQPPTYYMDSVGAAVDRWQRLDNPLRYSDGAELPGGYLDLIDIFADEDDPTVVLARGTIDRDGPATLGPCMVLSGGTADIADGDEGDYYLVMLDPQGGVLSRAGFDVSFDMMTAEGTVELAQASFVYRVEWPQGTARIELQDGDGTVLAGIAVSPGAPEVQVLGPNGGETFYQGEAITLTWQASDADGDPLSFSLAASGDGGETWLPLDTDVTGSEYRLDTQVLDTGGSYLVRVRATDGVNTAEDTSDGTFTIAEGAGLGQAETTIVFTIALAIAALVAAVALIGLVLFLVRRSRRGSS
ncbi:MAG: putative Ig domain-containing protein [Chloroflexota bacterium]|nr:putative Ig domain-containing protein [Chloroflexota bacterium]